MLQFKYSMYDYRKNLGIMIVFLIQLIILFISIVNVSDEVFRNYLSYKIMKELYDNNRDCILFNIYVDMEGTADSFNGIREPLRIVLTGQNEARAMTYCVSGDTVYVLGGWKNIKSFKEIPYTSGVRVYNGNSYDGNDHGKLPSTTLLKNGPKGNIFNIDKSKIVFINESILFDKNFMMNFFEMEQIIGNLILFTDDSTIIEEYVDSINSNMNNLFIIPITIKEALNDLRSSRFSFGNDLDISLFVIILAFSIIIGLISSMYLIINKNMREYAIHFMVGATVYDIYLRGLLLLNIMLLPGLLLGYNFYRIFVFAIDIKILTIVLYLTLILCGFLPLYIKFNRSKNKLDLTRGNIV